MIQEWVSRLTFMQQAVLLTSLRGPDGIHKNHVSKLLIRWLRRCVVLSAFDGGVLARPFDRGEPRGGSFTGASISHEVRRVGVDIFEHGGQAWLNDWRLAMNEVLSDYLKTTDELPHHFQIHFLHAAQIIGYKHPDEEVRGWWNQCYARLVNDGHLFPESEELMDKRLGDNEAGWREREEVVAS